MLPIPHNDTNRLLRRIITKTEYYDIFEDKLNLVLDNYQLKLRLIVSVAVFPQSVQVKVKVTFIVPGEKAHRSTTFGAFPPVL